jgi:hypothetical protein
MAHGRQTEMAHQYPSEQLTNSELWEEREQAIANLGKASLFFDSVATEFSNAQQEGNIPADLWEVNNEAHKQKIAATGWLMDVNRRITQAGL